jgi:hypothetical protein
MEFGRGLARIVKACRQEVDDVTLEVYTEALCYDTEPAEWDAFTLHVVRSGRFSWFPKVAELIDALREFRGERPLYLEAAEAYARVMDAGQYTAEGGTSWNYRTVAERCGRAAAEAFLAAGGPTAFATTWDEARRRERFLAAYQQAAREVPASRLLPAGPEAKALPPAPDAPISDTEAKGFLEQLRAHLPEGVEMPQPRHEPMVVLASDERLAELRRQAEQITAEEITVEWGQ